VSALARRPTHTKLASPSLLPSHVASPFTEKHRGFGFVTFEQREDAKAAIENMNNSELYGRVLRVNVAKPQKAKAEGSGKAVWADENANSYFDHEEPAEKLEDQGLDPEKRHRHPGKKKHPAPVPAPALVSFAAD